MTINNNSNLDDNINMYNLHKYDKTNILSYIPNKQIVIYLIFLIVVLCIIKYTNNFSYVFLFICLIVIYVYFNQKIITLNVNKKDNDKKIFLEHLNIKSTSLIARDDELLRILYEAKFIQNKAPEQYTKIIAQIEYFLVIYETLKQNINNIYLTPTDMIRPFNLKSNHHSILINDLRDQLELILKNIQPIIHVLPQDLIYLEAFYQFNQIIRSHLSRYYNRILSDYKINDHTSKYLLIRSSEDKYGILNNVFDL